MKTSKRGNARRADANGSDSGELVRAFQRLASEVFMLNGEFLAAGERLGRDMGISPARWQALATIRNQPMTVSQIARRLGLTRQSVQRTVGLLIDDGLASNRTNPRHRRSHLVAPTRRGRAVIDRLRERQLPLTNRFTEELGLDVEDLESLAHQLARLRETAHDVGREK